MDWRYLHPGHQRKPCPPGFAEVFIVGGWRGVEAAFGSRTDCNKRWVQECGGDKLKARRLEYLAARQYYRALMRQKPRKLAARKSITSPAVHTAIEILRSLEGGSWPISETGQGDYYFGATRQTGEQLIDRARRRGFNFDPV